MLFIFSDCIVTGDFASCFFDQTGRDIQDGRLTWLIVNAYLRANPAQKKALQENYGAEESDKADIVKQVRFIKTLWTKGNCLGRILQPLKIFILGSKNHANSHPIIYLLYFISYLQIYDNLNLQKMCGIAIEESREGLYRYIQQLGETAGLPTQFYLNLLDNIEDMA